MKRMSITIALMLSSFLNIAIFAQGDNINTINVNLDSFFKLDPIKGISGEYFEENSRFVQRFIYSPLVIPLQDPYLQDKYEISQELSLINNDFEYSNTGRDDDWQRYSGNWDTASLQRNGRGYKYFRVTLRDGLKFYDFQREGRRSTGRLNAPIPLGREDVVFSYRMVRVTSDRKCDEFLRRKGKLEINTLLYTKILAFNDVYCDADQQKICFEMRIDYKLDEFLKQLVYVPILSAVVIGSDAMVNNPGSNEYKKIHERWNMKEFRTQGRLNQPEFNLYDLYRDGGEERLRRRPMGYGQFLVTDLPSGSTDSDQSLYSRITLKRNPYWCSFAVKGPKEINHTDYQDNILTVRIIGDNEKTNSNRILDLLNTTPTAETTMNNNDIVYNIPISLATFNLTDASTSSFADIIEKKEMQISHNLYALLFGPDPKSARAGKMPDRLRIFFTKMINRPAIENIIRFGNNSNDIPGYLGSNSNKGLFLSDIKIRRLYYPFYFGGGYQGNMMMRDLDEKMLSNDLLTLEYIDEINIKDGEIEVNKLREHYQGLRENLRDNFISRYMRGGISPTLNRRYFERLKSEYIELLKRDDIVLNTQQNHNRLEIEILHSRDEICKQIALYYKNVLEIFFNGIVSVNIETNPMDYDLWKNKANNNARNNKYTFYIHGWTYRLDILNILLNQFTGDRHIMDEIIKDYEELIKQNTTVEVFIQKMSRRFEVNQDSSIMDPLPVPLVSVQNYSLFRSGDSVLAQIKKLDNLQLMLFPYYWRVRSAR